MATFTDDHFDDESLDVAWTIDVDSGGSVTEPAGTKVEMLAGDNPGMQSSQCTRLSGAYQSSISGEFDVTFLLTDYLEPGSFREVGIAAKVDDTNFVFLEIVWIGASTDVIARHCTSGSGSSDSDTWSAPLPVWLRISRDSGDEFHTYFSDDNENWTEIVPATPLDNSSDVEIWMHTSWWDGVASAQNTAKFDWAYTTGGMPSTSLSSSSSCSSSSSHSSSSFSSCSSSSSSCSSSFSSSSFSSSCSSSYSSSCSSSRSWSCSSSSSCSSSDSISSSCSSSLSSSWSSSCSSSRSDSSCSSSFSSSSASSVSLSSSCSSSCSSSLSYSSSSQSISSCSSCSSSSSSASCNALITYGSNQFPYGSMEVDPLPEKHKLIGALVYEDEFDGQVLETTKVWDEVNISTGGAWTSPGSYALTDGRLVSSVHGPELGGANSFIQELDGEGAVDFYTRVDMGTPLNIYGDTSKPAPTWPDPRVSYWVELWETISDRGTDLLVSLVWGSPATVPAGADYWTYFSPPSPSPAWTYDPDDYDWWIYAFKTTYLNEAPWWSSKEVYIRVGQPYLYMRLRATHGASGDVLYSLTEPTKESDWTLIAMPTDDFVEPFIFDFSQAGGSELWIYPGCNAGAPPVSHTIDFIRRWPYSNWRDYNRPTVNEQSTEQVYSGSYSRKFTAKYRPGDQEPQGILSDSFLLQEHGLIGTEQKGDVFADGTLAPFWTFSWAFGSGTYEEVGRSKWTFTTNHTGGSLEQDFEDGYFDIWFGMEMPPLDEITNESGNGIAHYIWDNDFDYNGYVGLAIHKYSDDYYLALDMWNDTDGNTYNLLISQNHVWCRFKYDANGTKLYYALTEPTTDDDWIDGTNYAISDPPFDLSQCTTPHHWLGPQTKQDHGNPTIWYYDFLKAWPYSTADYQLDFWVYPVDRNKVTVTTIQGSTQTVHSFTGLTENTWNRCTKIITLQEQTNTQIAWHSGAQESGTWYIDDAQLRKLACEGSSSSSSCSSSSS